LNSFILRFAKAEACQLQMLSSSECPSLEDIRYACCSITVFLQQGYKWFVVREEMDHIHPAS
jgi:hypothetical protein